MAVQTAEKMLRGRMISYGTIQISQSLGTADGCSCFFHSSLLRMAAGTVPGSLPPDSSHHLRACSIYAYNRLLTYDSARLRGVADNSSPG